jgi:Uma2 family endonuclease
MANRTAAAPRSIYYPMSDGKPIADNTLQFDWIVKLFNGLAIQYADISDVFIASNLNWYPVEGQPRIRTAPDVMVALGRPKGYRSSYLQWQEDGIAPQVVFEIRSPRNRPPQLQRLFEFYQRYVVEEYYFYDPYKLVLNAWRRVGNRLKAIGRVDGWKSPRLSIRFELADDGLHVFGSNGLEFVSPEEQSKREEAKRQRLLQEQEHLRQSRDQERARYDALRHQLRARGIDPDQF